MSILMVNDKVDFNFLKEKLEQSDGNLASHLTALENLEYVTVAKQFVGKKPNTTYKATASGKKAFNKHLDGLEELLKGR